MMVTEWACGTAFGLASFEGRYYIGAADHHGEKPMSPSKWARVTQAEAYGLRRGAWYPVVSNSNSTTVVLDVNKSNRPVNRAHLEFSGEPPDKWSVVQRSPEDRAAKRASDRELGPVYGVCPECRERTIIEERVPSLACPSCGTEHEVDWDNPC